MVKVVKSGEKWEKVGKGGEKVGKSGNKRPVGLIAPPFIISFLATGN